MILGKDGVERLPPPVGTSDWATFSRDSYCVDKTLMIKELIDEYDQPITTASVYSFYDEMWAVTRANRY